MRKLLLAAAATIAIASPAVARDGAPYVGLDAGVMFTRNQTLFTSIDFTDPTRNDFPRASDGNVRYKMGYDVDVNGGYDFGMFRLEGELGYKHATRRSNNFLVNDPFLLALNTGSGNAFPNNADFGFKNSASIFSAMVNGLLDFGGNGGPGGYAGGGVGYGHIKQWNGSKSGFSWQLIAGVYTPITDNFDIGLKYRFFRGPKVSGTRAFAFTTGTATDCGTVACSPGTAFFDTDSRWQSHSLLLSLTYNFAPPPPPPPPPPP
ncbi:MAG: outer membrane beta-barrel protein, partial [Sphingomicrobium sp.]